MKTRLNIGQIDGVYVGDLEVGDWFIAKAQHAGVYEEEALYILGNDTVCDGSKHISICVDTGIISRFKNDVRVTKIYDVGISLKGRGTSHER